MYQVGSSKLFDRDYQFGKQSEDALLVTIQNHFNDEIVKAESAVSKWDFIGKSNVYELKTRRNTYQQYPTTLIGEDKIVSNAVFLFQFSDGLYYIKYDKERFSSFEVKNFRRFRPGVADRCKPYVYIPIEFLEKIEC